MNFERLVNIFLVPFFLFIQFTLLAAESNEVHDIQYYIDCGINENTVRGGQFSNYNLDCQCNQIKENRMKRTLTYFGVGCGVFVFFFFIFKRINTRIKEDSEFKRLQEVINSIYLTLTEIEKEKGGGFVNKNQQELIVELSKLEKLTSLEVHDRIAKFGWSELKPVIIPSISSNSTTIGIAVSKLNQKLRILSC